MRRSPMPPRTTPLARGTAGLKRTPFVDHKAGARRSAQATFSAAVRARGRTCEACHLILRADLPNPPRSYSNHDGEHAHHILPKGRGGADDAGNGAWVCGAAHRWIHDNPAEAERLGLLKSSCTPQ